MRLSGKTALITGGGSGLGYATATLFHREGAQVAICGRRAETLTQATRSIGADVLAVAADATKEDAVEQMVEATIQRFGKLDLLVHAAGIHPQRTDIAETSLEGFRATMEGNTTSAFLAARAAVKHMNRGGAIVMVGSIVAQLGSSNRFPYSTSKAALVGMARQMAVSLGPRGIRVNVLQPAMIRTEMTANFLDSMTPEQLERMRRSYPLGRLGEPEDVAEACLYLCSDAASWITGVILNVDGGVSLS